MIDTDRLNRIHVVTVRGDKDKFIVVLHDPKNNDTFTVSWDYWISLSKDERWNYTG